VFRFAIWLARRFRSAGQPPPRGDVVTVRFADGQFAQGQAVPGQVVQGQSGQGPNSPTVVLVAQPGGPPQQRRRGRFPRWAVWTALIVLVGLMFRRVVAWAVTGVLSAALGLFGVHLPHVSFGWPWSSSSSTTTTTTTTTNTLVGPIVLQKIQGIDKPALAANNFDFIFTRKVTKNIGFWPCWYSATFSAVGRASATVDLNPGPSWWKAATGHYKLQTLTSKTSTTPGHVAIAMSLPLPQLPQSVHDVSVDNTLSQPIRTDHSWTYPGLGCGVLIRPEFSQAVLYAQAQSEAFYQATHLTSVTGPLIAAAEREAVTIIRDNFIVPTLNALGYTVTRFTIRWVTPTSGIG
jgi:hypothetical protein